MDLEELAGFPQIERINVLNRGAVFSIRCKDGKLVLGKTKETVLREYLTAEGIEWRKPCGACQAWGDRSPIHNNVCVICDRSEAQIIADHGGVEAWR